MDPAGLAAAWSRVIASLADAPLRAAYARSELGRHPAAEVAAALEELCHAAQAGAAEACDVLRALAPALGDEALIAPVAAVRVAALGAGLQAAAQLLAARRPTAVDDGRPAEVAVAESGRPLTLGERKALARGPSRRTLERLLRDPDPSVVRVLLANPRLTEADVLRLAARRPGRAEVLAEIARHDRWPLRPRVRLALVCNPATPTAVVTPLLPLLARTELEFAAEATDLPAVVREAIIGRLGEQKGR